MKILKRLLLAVFAAAKNTLLILSTFVFCFLCFEAALRGYHAYVKYRSPYQHASRPDLIFTVKPNSRSHQVSDGFRRRYSERKENDVTRILIFGDSVTFGYHIEKEDIYSANLERLLNSGSKKFEVVNYGISQYSTVQEVALAEAYVSKMSPDLIILGYVLNDPNPDGSVNDFFKRDKARSLAGNWLLERIKLLTNNREEDPVLAGCEFFDYYSRMHCSVQKWGAVQNAFQRLADLSAQYDFPVLLVIFPMFSSEPGATFSEYPWVEVHEQVRNEGIKNGFEVLDLLPDFSRYEVQDFKLADHDRLHPNKFGHEVAAKAIYEKLKRTGIAETDNSLYITK